MSRPTGSEAFEPEASDVEAFESEACAELVVDIVTLVVSSLLDIEADVIDAGDDPLRDAALAATTFKAVAADGLLGCVTIDGAWSGAVTVACSDALLRRFAMRMLALPADAIVVEDLRDVLGELTNIIGGNFKSSIGQLQGGSCRLSLPIVASGPLGVRGVRPLLMLPFNCGGALLQVRIDVAAEAGNAR